MLPLFSLSPSSPLESVPELQNGCVVSVDCDGDNNIDYSMVVDCEFEDDMREQLTNSCE